MPTITKASAGLGDDGAGRGHSDDGGHDQDGGDVGNDILAVVVRGRGAVVGGVALA